MPSQATLIKAIYDANKDVRQMAGEAMAALMKWSPKFDALINNLNNLIKGSKIEDNNVRASILDALSNVIKSVSNRISDTNVVNVQNTLMRLQDDKDDNIRQSAAQCLGNLGVFAFKSSNDTESLLVDFVLDLTDDDDDDGDGASNEKKKKDKSSDDEDDDDDDDDDDGGDGENKKNCNDKSNKLSKECRLKESKLVCLATILSSTAIAVENGETVLFSESSFNTFKSDILSVIVDFMENDRLFIKIAAIRCAFCYLHSLYAFNENEKEISKILLQFMDIIDENTESNSMDVKEASAMYLRQFLDNCVNKSNIHSIWFLNIVLAFLLKNLSIRT